MQKMGQCDSACFERRVRHRTVSRGTVRYMDAPSYIDVLPYGAGRDVNADYLLYVIHVIHL